MRMATSLENWGDTVIRGGSTPLLSANARVGQLASRLT
jgi:hypothetical protein